MSSFKITCHSTPSAFQPSATVAPFNFTGFGLSTLGLQHILYQM